MGSHLDRDISFLESSINNDLIPAKLSSEVRGNLLAMMVDDLNNKKRKRRASSQSAGIEMPVKTEDEVLAINYVFLPDENDKILSIDWVITTAATQELKAVRDYLKLNNVTTRKAYLKAGISKPAKLCRVFEYNLPNKVVRNVLLICATGQRKDPMLSLLQDIAILDNPPFACFMVGMMGAIRGKAAKLLDVVVPHITYSGANLSAENGRLTNEPGQSCTTHQAIKSVITNIDDDEYGDGITLVQRKNIISTFGKMDDLESEVAKTLLSVDPENVIGFEQEGEAIVQVMAEQQRGGDNIIFGLAKGVADYCSIGIPVDEDEVAGLKLMLPELEVFGSIDPTGNKETKVILQREATLRSFRVALVILMNMDRART